MSVTPITTVRAWSRTMISPVGVLTLVAGDAGLRAVIWPG